MIAEVERWFCVRPDLFFARLWDGNVVIVTTDGRKPSEGGVRSQTVIDAVSWASVVLTMSAFNERPGDWHVFMAHHDGRRDLMDAAKLAEVDRNRAERYQQAYERLLESRLPTNNA